MRSHPLRRLLLLCLFCAAFLGRAPEAAAQEARYLSLGLSAGPGAVQLRGLDDTWTLGPVMGGRLEWGNRRSAALLRVDVQPFRGKGTPTSGDFRALYVLPSYGVAVGSGGRRVGFGLGLGVFDFKGGTGKEGVEVGFVAAAAGSARITGSYFVELGWRRMQNVKGLRANVWSLQLVRRWRL